MSQIPPIPAPANRATQRRLWRALLSRWTWVMAWRDSRTSRRKLWFFSCSIVLGIAALTAIGSLGINLERAIEEQAKALLGADLALGSRQPFGPAEADLLAEIGGERSFETTFSSMISFVETNGARLVQVRALEGGFPFYGALETDPPGAVDAFRRGEGALVEESLLTQFGARVGDHVRLGKLTTPIVGRLRKVPGETVAFATIAPRVYLAMPDLGRTGLLRPGSLARYRVFFRLPPGVDAGKLVARLRSRLDERRIGHSTVEERKRDLGRSMENLYHYLNLVGFVALLLGGVGVASAIHVHVKHKLGAVAVLRCLGSSVGQAFAIYLAQGLALGMFGTLLGAALGLGVQLVLPRVLNDFIPFTLEVRPAWFAVGRAMFVGFSICVLFALWPLLAVRRVSPLAALRVELERPRRHRDPLNWLVGLTLGAGIVGFAITQSKDWHVGIGFAAGLATVFALLTLTAQGLIVMARRLVPATLPFPIRQGLANLHRPNNRTLLLLLSLGLGTFLLASLFLVEHSFLNQLVASGNTGQANALLFEIQPDQRQAVAGLVRSLNLPVLDEAPIVTMRLASVKGRTVESLLADKTDHIPNWTLRREYRCTYEDHLRDSEKLVAGEWWSGATNKSEVVPISVEDGIARELEVGLGDAIEFDVQGVPVKTRVASLRQVDWRRVQPNFYVVFPPGVLENAPAMHVVVTHVSSSEESARLQRSVVGAFPGVSVIDLTLVLQTLDSILDKISYVVRFMAMFTVLTGLLVLVGALLTGRFQRIQESVLLRTLGATQSQIFRVLLAEYLALGVLSALTGLSLAVAAAWALSLWVFKGPFAVPVGLLGIALLAVPALVLAVGLLLSRGVTKRPPLEILRNEVWS